MSTTESRVAFDVGALRRSIEERDAATLIGLYADDAELRLVDKLNPPSNPKVLRGRAAIAEHHDDICGRDMTHRVENLMTDGRTLSFTQSCAYPSGGRVLCLATVDLAGGRIVRQLAVQVWDE
jgi:hypothetical protein